MTQLSEDDLEFLQRMYIKLCSVSMPPIEFPFEVYLAAIKSGSFMMVHGSLEDVRRMIQLQQRLTHE